jgi:hypothetical protein
LLRLEESTGAPLMDDDPPHEPAGKSAAGVDTEIHRSLTVAAPLPGCGSVSSS